MDPSPSAFLAAVGERRSFADSGRPSGLSYTPHGDAPTPFDALDGERLAGPSGSHPLALIDPRTLISPTTPGLVGAIELAGPVRVGEGISGRLRVQATRDINARGAVLRLLGLRLSEQTRQTTVKRGTGIDLSSGQVSFGSSSSGSDETVSWVEVHGTIFDTSPFTEPAIPAQLAAGQSIDLPFLLPAPQLGPPSAHAGSALIAWALEARWDIGMGSDERVAALVDVRQHPDLLRAGVLDLGAGAMSDSVADNGATIGVQPEPPFLAGSSVDVAIAWPGAPGGRSARIELTVDVKASVGLTVVPVSLPLDLGALTSTVVRLPIPVDAPATLITDGLAVGYRLRVIVDRKLRSDVSAERRIVIC